MNQQYPHRAKGSKRTLQSIIAAISLPLIVAVQMTPLAGIAVLAEDSPEAQSTVSPAIQADTSSAIPLLDPAGIDQSPSNTAETSTTTSLNTLGGGNALSASSSIPSGEGNISPTASSSLDDPSFSATNSASSSASSTDASSVSANSSTTPFSPSFTSTQSIDFTSIGTTTAGTTTSIGTSTDAVELNASTAGTSTTTSSSTEEKTGIQGPLPQGTTTIQTGDAVSLTNVLNLANTNLVNSTGSIVMANITEDPNKDIDLRAQEGSIASLPACTLLACNGIDSVTVNVDANASIDNNVAIVAKSGTNGISTAGSAEIFTGNTYAGLNLVNLANTNLISSQYFILALNSFADVHGDIIFPSLKNLSNQGGTSTFSTLAFSENAQVINNVGVEANSGNNTQTNIEHGTIETGNAISSTNVYNAINSLLLGGRSVAIFLKVSGTWLGELFGAPEGTRFIETNGLQILQMEDGNNPFSLSEYASSTILSTSTAHIANNVDVAADSGNNATEYSSSSLIRTGTSHAAANIVNIANTNVVGKNWVLGIINIFGNFKGNISFGRPDIWLGEQVTGPSFIDNGASLVYKVRVANKGDSRASAVAVSSEYDAAHLDIVSSSVPYAEPSPGKLSFDLGTLSAGDTREVTFTATVKNTAPGTEIAVESRATEHEPDNNPADNADQTTITTTLPSISGTGSNMTIAPINPVTSIAPMVPLSVAAASSSGISIAGSDLSGVGGGEGELFENVTVSRKTPAIMLVGAGTKGEQVIVLRNNSEDIIPNAVFDDILYDKNGNEIKRETWDLDAIQPFEEITLTYNLSFKEDARPGVYTLSSQLKKANDPKSTYANNGTVNFVVPMQMVSFIEKPLLPIAENPAKTTVLSALAESFSPSIAYAAESGSPFVPIQKEETPYVWWAALLLLFIALYFYIRGRRPLGVH